MAVFVAMKRTTANQYIAKGKWTGCPHTAIGMCVEMQDRILSVISANVEDIDSEEPGDGSDGVV